MAFKYHTIIWYLHSRKSAPTPKQVISMNYVKFCRAIICWHDEKTQTGSAPFLSIKDSCLIVETTPVSQNMGFLNWAKSKSSIDFIASVEELCGNPVDLTCLYGKSVSVKTLTASGCKLFKTKRGRLGDTFAHYLIACEFLRSASSRHKVAAFILAKNFTEYVASKEDASLSWTSHVDAIEARKNVLLLGDPESKAAEHAFTQENRMISLLAFGRMPWSDDEQIRIDYMTANPSHHNMIQAGTADEKRFVAFLRMQDALLVGVMEYAERKNRLIEASKKFLLKKKSFCYSPFTTERSLPRTMCNNAYEHKSCNQISI